MIPRGTSCAPAHDTDQVEPDATELDPTELGAWRGMLRVTHRLRRALGETLTREHGLSMADYDALVALHDAGPGVGVRMVQLAETILQPRSSVTRIIDSLERRELVRRDPAHDDRRGAVARLTPRGARLYAAAHRTHLRGIRDGFLDHLDRHQLEHLASAWSAIDPEVHR